MRKRTSKTAIKLLKDVSKKIDMNDVKFSPLPAEDALIKRTVSCWLHNTVKKPIDDIVRHMTGEIGILELRERNTI